MGRKRMRSRLEGEASGCVCVECGCGIMDDEQKVVSSMTGEFGCLVNYHHVHSVQCLNALKERVRELEKVVATHALRTRSIVSVQPDFEEPTDART